MTERGRRHVQRSPDRFVIGPSDLHWDGNALHINIRERAVPFGHKVIGKVKVTPDRLFNFSTALDDGGRHRWGPLAPSARVEVDMSHPGLRWQGHAYFDSNEGDEPVARCFTEWDWSRSSLADGSTAVLYDVRQKRGGERLLALRFSPKGEVETFEAPPRQALPRTAWRIGRSIRTEPGRPASVVQTLEDTPFYVRSVLSSGLLGEQVVALHETLNVPRFASTVVQMMLPFRMPRVA